MEPGAAPENSPGSSPYAPEHNGESPGSTIPSGRGHFACWLTPSIVLLMIVGAVFVLLAVGVLHYAVERAENASIIERFRQLGLAAQIYKAQHDGSLPQRGTDRSPTWAQLGEPQNANAWYNQVPPLAGKPSAAELSKDPDRFYTAENSLYLPKVPYPATKNVQPLFAVAFNFDVLRPPEPVDRRVPDPVERRTVLFFEAGLPGEKKAHPKISVHSGAPDAGLRALASRRGGKAAVTYFDGSVGWVRFSDVFIEATDVP